VAEIEHLQRIVELLPSFEDALKRTILPGVVTTASLPTSIAYQRPIRMKLGS